jgi:hypothetical protein
VASELIPPVGPNWAFRVFPNAAMISGMTAQAKQNPRTNRKRRKVPVRLLLLLGAAVLVWAIYWLVLVLFPFKDDHWESRGKFGDMFGAFTALFTACAFVAIIYGIRLEYKAFRRQELHSALSAQLDTLIQLAAMPQAQREPVWRAIVEAPGGPTKDLSIDQAIATQIQVLDRLMADEDLDVVPTYGRVPLNSVDGVAVRRARPTLSVRTRPRERSYTRRGYPLTGRSILRI